MDSKITADVDCSHGIRRGLLLRRKALTNLEGILMQRHHFADKGPIVKAIVFPLVMYRCESWNVKKGNTKELMFSNCGAGKDS